MQLTIEIDEAECLGVEPEAVAEALVKALSGGLTLADGSRIEHESMTLFYPDEVEESMTQLVARTNSELAIEATRLGMPAPRTALDRILVRLGGTVKPRTIPKGRKLKVLDPALEREKLMRCAEYIEMRCAGDEARVKALDREMKEAYRWAAGEATHFGGGWRYAALIDCVLQSAEERERATRAHLAMVLAWEWDSTTDPRFCPEDRFAGLRLDRLREGGGFGRWWLGEEERWTYPDSAIG